MHHTSRLIAVLRGDRLTADGSEFRPQAGAGSPGGAAGSGLVWRREGTGGRGPAPGEAKHTAGGSDSREGQPFWLSHTVNWLCEAPPTERAVCFTQSATSVWLLVREHCADTPAPPPVERRCAPWPGQVDTRPRRKTLIIGCGLYGNSLCRLQNFPVNLKLFLKNLLLKMPEIFEGRVILLL